MTQRSAPVDTVTYFVTDIEADGPRVEDNSMLAFATVAVRSDGEILDSFEAVLEPLAGHRPDPSTTRWWEGFPEAHEHATTDPRPPKEVMLDYVRWVETHPGPRAFAARPVLFDGPWIDSYLRRFADRSVFEGSLWHVPLFDRVALDIESYAHGVLGRTTTNAAGVLPPDHMMGDHPHTHRAIDDALGFATYLSQLLLIAIAGDKPEGDGGGRPGF